MLVGMRRSEMEADDAEERTDRGHPVEPDATPVVRSDPRPKHIVITADPNMAYVGQTARVRSWDSLDAVVELDDGTRRIVYEGEWRAATPSEVGSYRAVAE